VDEKISKQIGLGNDLSGKTNKTVVCDFRQNDIKNGGEGAPLTPISFQHTGLAVVLQGLVRPRLRGTELEFWRNSEEARTDRPSQQLRSLNGEWRLMRYFLLTHLCGISHRIWCTLSTICSDAA
jgi:Predicted molecular chaperone distantly related to HSP70-fold metalloproteases